MAIILPLREANTLEEAWKNKMSFSHPEGHCVLQCSSTVSPLHGLCTCHTSCQGIPNSQLGCGVKNHTFIHVFTDGRSFSFCQHPILLSFKRNDHFDMFPFLSLIQYYDFYRESKKYKLKLILLCVFCHQNRVTSYFWEKGILIHFSCLGSDLLSVHKLFST